MAPHRIARTTTRDLQPLGTAGQLAVDLWSVLSALLTRELSADHAALLAEPVPDPRRGEVDWYTDRPGPAVSLADLQQGQAEAEARLGELVAAIYALANRFLAARSDGERFSGEMLLLCIQVPDHSRVFVVAGQPVLVAWGHARAGGTAVQATVTGRRAPGPGRMVILPPPRLPAPSGRNWALFLSGVVGATLVLSAGLLLLLFLNPFSDASADPAMCAVPPTQAPLAAALDDAVAREGALQLELARLEADAGQRRHQCAPVTAALPSPAPNRDAQRAERQGGKTGKLQVILAWDDRNDLDLHVVCTSGVIDFQTPRACGGTLDVDANGVLNALTDTPVENVYFLAPDPGRYSVVVDPYGMRVGATSPFRVTIRQEGKPDREVTGVAVSGRNNQTVAEIEVAAP